MSKRIAREALIWLSDLFASLAWALADLGYRLMDADQIATAKVRAKERHRKQYEALNRRYEEKL